MAIFINSHFIRINIRNGKENLIMTEIIIRRKMKSNIINFLFIILILNMYLTLIILSSTMHIKIENKVKRILNKSHKNLDSIRRKINMIISSKISPRPLIYIVIKCLYWKIKKVMSSHIRILSNWIKKPRTILKEN
jgi:hypothetical protein